MKRKVGNTDDGNSAKFKKKKKTEPKFLSKEERERRKTSYYRPPTSEELNELKENENLYKNNLFRMEIDYLLEEVKLKEKSMEKLNDILHSLNRYLTELTVKGKERQLSEEKCCRKDIKFPLPDIIPKSHMKGKFKFIPPTEVKVIGSYLLKTLTKPKIAVDLAIEIPKDVLETRDSINFRYHYKRALYLSWVASLLKSWEHVEEIQFLTKHDIYKPILQLTLKGKIGKKFMINLYLSIPTETFKLNRFGPLKNNVRSNWYEGLDNAAIEEIEFPTPHYNTGILSDMLYESHLHILYNAIKECPGIKDAVCLFKVWLQQRSFKGEHPFNGFIGSMLMAYLLQKRKISPHMSSYQIFRLFLNYLASSNWAEKGISLCEEQQERIPLSDFHSVFDVVFVDSSGYLNVAAHIDTISYKMICHQAKLSMEMFDNAAVNSFECLFIKRHLFREALDHTFSVSSLKEFKQNVSKNESHKFVLMDHGGDWTKLLTNQVYSILQKGLGNRVSSISVKPQAMLTWATHSSPPDWEDHTSLFGVNLNTEECENMLIMGPPAEKPEARDFRELWGEKSQLRRFQDGSINEAVLFKCANLSERKLITKKIILHLLNLHCSIPNDSIVYHADEADSILRPKYQPTSHDAKYQPGCGEEEATRFVETFSALSKEIRSLDDLPLVVNSIQGIDPAFRMTEVASPRQHSSKITSDTSSKTYLVPRPNKTSTWCPRYHVNIQFETSGKWPDEIDAIQHIKTAFHIKLSQCIRAQLHYPAVASPAFVDVVKNGYVFRLSVVHYREMILYKETVATGSIKREYELAGKHLDTLIVKKPLHTSLIHGLSSKFHSYPCTVRLCKKWLASHMLSDYYEEETVELLVAYLFLNPSPLETPNSHLSGFIRFLNHMAKFDWENQPLIVNLNSDIKVENYASIGENFTTQRAQLPAMFIATSYDHDASVWTKHHPSKQVIRRTTILATEALGLIENNTSSLSQEMIERMFRCSLEDYDVVIVLEKQHVPLYYLSMDSSYQIKTTQPKDNLKHSVVPVAGFDPVRQYVDELKDAFSDIAMFFHDRYGGLHVGVVWKTEAHTSQPFKILRSQYKSIVETKTKSSKKKGSITAGVVMKPNLSAVLSDFRIMGKGLVVNIKENT